MTKSEKFPRNVYFLLTVSEKHKKPQVKSYSFNIQFYLWQHSQSSHPPPSIRVAAAWRSWSYFFGPITALQVSPLTENILDETQTGIFYTRSLTNHSSTNCQRMCTGIVAPKVFSMSVKVITHSKFRNVGFTKYLFSSLFYNGPQIPHPPLSSTSHRSMMKNETVPVT